MSLREAAARAGVSKNTILRLESGLPVRYESRRKLCAAYGIFCFDPDHESGRVGGEGYALHPRASLKWHRAKLPGPGSDSVVASADEYADPGERARQGRYGLANQFFAYFDCAFEHGHMRAGIFEVFGPSGTSSQNSGEAFVYAIRGSLLFTVGDESFLLAEGSAAIFDRTRPHHHEPAPDTRREDLPAVLLYVQAE